MAIINYSSKKFPGLKIVYLQDQKKINIFVGSSKNKEKFNDLLDNLQTNLNTKSFPLKGGVQLKTESQPEAIQAILLHKGFQESVLEDDEEDVNVNTDSVALPPPTPQQAGLPAPPSNESMSFSNIFDILFESTYRSAEYWKNLEQVLGRSKHQIVPKDILKLRREYANKITSEKRNKILRSLDSSMKYFFRKLKNETGPRAAMEFKLAYKSIGTLVPTDYAETKLTPDENPEQSPEEQQKEIDFSDFFDDESSLEDKNYDDIDIEK